MKIEHVALWVKDLEKAKTFYTRHFNGHANRKYTNPKKGFESYFITFESGARLELMHRDGTCKHLSEDHPGWAHIAFSLGSKEAVDVKTKALTEAGHPLYEGPRTTGDGYYESVIGDPDGNRVELTV
ncbi:MAG: VOC family protein [Candidatus Izemoplasmataceae bacterium]